MGFPRKARKRRIYPTELERGHRRTEPGPDRTEKHQGLEKVSVRNPANLHGTIPDIRKGMKMLLFVSGWMMA